MKKSLLTKFLLVLIIATLVLSGCQPGTSTPTEDPTTPAPAPGTETEAQDDTEPPEEELDPLELVWYSSVDVVRPDTDMVWDEINKYLEEKINTTIDYYFYTRADYQEVIPAVINSGQYVDIIGHGSIYGDFTTLAQQEAFYPITDLIPEYLPETYKIVPEGAWDAVTYNGEIYAVVPYKDLAARWGFLYNKTMTDKYDLNIPGDGEFSTFRDIIPLLYEAKEARDADQPDLAEHPIMKMMSSIDAYYPREVINTLAVTNIPGVDAYAGKGSGETVFNIYETDEFKEYVTTIKKLVDDGIFPYDASNYDTDSELERSGIFVGGYPQGYIEIQADMNPGRETAHSYSNLTVMSTGYVQAMLQTVSIQTDHPERSLMFLELLNTDPTLATYARFGIEDEHYIVQDDGRLDVTIAPRNEGRDLSDYGYYHWYGGQFGNIIAGGLPTFVTNDFPDLLKDLNDNSIQDTNLGFAFDASPVANEIAACSNVISQYDSATNLRSGMVEDIDGVLDEFLSSLEANGSQKIVDEAQKQLTEWRASVGKPTAN